MNSFYLVEIDKKVTYNIDKNSLQCWDRNSSKRQRRCLVGVSVPFADHIISECLVLMSLSRLWHT